MDLAAISNPILLLAANAKNTDEEESRARGACQHIVAEVTASIIALGDDDLLDLAEIFSSDATTILSQIASTEMRRRNLSL